MKRKIIERTRNTMKMELVWTSMERMVRPARDPDTEEGEGGGRVNNPNKMFLSYL